MTWTAWNNGAHHRTGAGYGFKVESTDRDLYFLPQWETVLIELPRGSEVVSIEVNIDKGSFWGPSCRELISQAIGRWLIMQGYAPWVKGSPPKFNVQLAGEGRFVVLGVASPRSE
jgi:hypothetical protein